MTLNILLLDTFLGLPCWLLWALASLISFLLGWLLGRWLWGKCCNRVSELEAEIDGLKVELEEGKNAYASLTYKHDELEKDNTRLRALLQSCEADKAILDHKLDKLESMELGAAVVERDTGAVGSGFGVIFVPDNLQIIEGVGPKIEGLLKDAGYKNWSDVAGASYDDLKKVLDDAGPRYRIHDPKTWAKQAQLAHEDKWEELIEYQKFLDTGRESKGDFETPSKVEKMAAKILGFSNNSNDLKVVEGIGPKIEGLLKDAGINNWSELAAASEAKLQGVLDAAGDRYRLADPSTWAKQAGLAASADWAKLSEFQDFLKGGKHPGK